MGLDYVELIMRAEEEFGITIEDAEAEQLTTPGKLCTLVERKLGIIEANKSSGCPTSRAFYRVRRELVACGVERAHIKPQAQLSHILPLAKRRRTWGELGQHLSLNLPPLERPALFTAHLGIWLGLSLIFCWIIFLDPIAYGYWLFGGGALLWLGFHATTPLTLWPPREVRSVADLTRRVAGQSADVPASQRDVWPQVQLIVAEELSVPIEQVTRDADFFRDLGAG